MILLEKREKSKKIYYVDGDKVDWLVRTLVDYGKGGESGPVIIKYKLERFSGTYERQFTTIVVINEAKGSTTWELIDELPSADWAWDKLIERGVLI